MTTDFYYDYDITIFGISQFVLQCLKNHRYVNNIITKLLGFIAASS